MCYLSSWRPPAGRSVNCPDCWHWVSSPSEAACPPAGWCTPKTYPHSAKPSPETTHELIAHPFFSFQSHVRVNREITAGRRFEPEGGEDAHEMRWITSACKSGSAPQFCLTKIYGMWRECVALVSLHNDELSLRLPGDKDAKHRVILSHLQSWKQHEQRIVY